MHVRLQEGHPKHFRVLNSLTMRKLRSSECSELTQSTQSLLEEPPTDSKFLICRWCPSDIHPSAEAGKGSSATSNYSCSIDTLESSPDNTADGNHLQKRMTKKKWLTFIMFIVPRWYRDFDPQMSGVPDLRGVQLSSQFHSNPSDLMGFGGPAVKTYSRELLKRGFAAAGWGIFMAGFGVTHSQSRSCNGSEWTDTHIESYIYIYIII